MPHPDLVDPVFDGYDRGFPPESAGVRASDVAGRGWSLHRDLETPIATIREDHLRHNAAVMRDWCAAVGAELWPHAKTTMSPQLVALQLAHGAAGVTAATAAQARLLLDWGAPGVLVANQLVQRRAAARLGAIAAASGQALLSFVDSPAGVEVLDAAAADAGTTFDVLLELGGPGARTGVRDSAGRDDVLRALDRASRVRLAGVAGYEGSYAADRKPESNARASDYLVGLAELLAELVRLGAVAAPVPILSGGGSMHFDLVAEASRALGIEHRLVLRSGCYLLHDHGLFENATPLPETEGRPGLRAALTVWGTVHSRPEPTRAYVDLGRRDAGFDQGLPRPIARVPRGGERAEPVEGARALQLNDQHLHLELDPDSPIAIGDRLEFGVSHPCTTMDKWSALALVDADGAVVGAVTTRF